MEIANKTIKINDEKYEAVIYSDKNNLYVVISEFEDPEDTFVSSYYPSTQSYIYCIRQAVREYLKHIENIKELRTWDGVIKWE